MLDDYHHIRHSACCRTGPDVDVDTVDDVADVVVAAADIDADMPVVTADRRRRYQLDLEGMLLDEHSTLPSFPWHDIARAYPYRGYLQQQQ